jgi:hypothetical protein
MKSVCNRCDPRRGISLIELLAAMTAASVVMATAVGLVHRSFSLESRSRQVLGDERTAVRLARQFRADVHAAVAVRCVAAPAADAVLVVIDASDGTVRYRHTSAGLGRFAEQATGEVGREDFRFSRPVTWTADCRERLVSLRGIAAGGSTRLPRLLIDVVAAVPRSARGTMPGATP